MEKASQNDECKECKTVNLRDTEGLPKFEEPVPNVPQRIVIVEEELVSDEDS